MRSLSPASAIRASAQAFCSVDKRQPDDARPAPRRLDRQRAPAAADLEQAVAGLEVEPVEQRGDLALLRRLERARRAREARRRIGHRLVEPGGVEVVAEVVMRGDVVARLARVHCRAGGGAAALIQRAGPLARAVSPRLTALAHEQFEQGHRVGRGPFALRPRLVPADRARGRQPDQRHPAVDVDHRDRARARGSRPAAAMPSGKRRLDPAGQQPPVELVDEAREQAARDEPAEQAAPVAKRRSASTRWCAARAHARYPASRLASRRAARPC